MRMYGGMNYSYLNYTYSSGPLGPFFLGAPRPPMVKVIEYSTVEPITLDEARQHLRVDVYGSPPEHPDDNVIRWQISAAREFCEKYLGLAIANQTLEIALDEFIDPIQLPYGPVVSIEYVRYLDEEGIEQTIEVPDYFFDDYRGFIAPGIETPWPATQVISNAVKIRYHVGYALAGESPTNRQLPYPIKAAILLILGDLYEHRENSTSLKLEQIPVAAQTLLDMYRARAGFA